MLRKARELLAAFLALWVATDPSPENRADEALVRGDAPEWWQLAAELAAENEDAAGYTAALLRSVGLTPGRVEPQYRVRRSA